jgi:hypothetical protein
VVLAMIGDPGYRLSGSVEYRKEYQDAFDHRIQPQ